MITNMLLNKLDWKLHTGEMKQLKEFQIDVFWFKFQTPLNKEQAKQFADFVKTLDTKDYYSIPAIWLWLYQRNIKFKLSFRYNPELRLWYNLRCINEPKAMNKIMMSESHKDLMSTSATEFIEYRKENKPESILLICDRGFIG